MIEKTVYSKMSGMFVLEDVVALINDDKVLDIIRHPNWQKYPYQYIYIVMLNGYVHMVPFVKDGDEIFLKTIVPSRKMNKLYKGAGNENG